MEGDVLGIIIAIFLGALIGLQREYTQQHLHIKGFAGFRTFIFTSLFGAILGYLTGAFDSVWVIVGFVAIILFAISSYVIMYMKTKKIAATTQIVFIMTYVLGVMCVTGNSGMAVVFGILITTFLTFKERLHLLAKKMKGKEIVAMVKFALIAFVVLPFLPNKNFSPLDVPGLGEVLSEIGIPTSFLAQLDVFNFYNIWLMVIFIAGINLVGYFSVKLIGSKRGYGLIGFVGGLISSTAVALSMSEESNRNKKVIRPFLLATVIATSVMFVRVIFEVAVINSDLLYTLVAPMGAMAIAGFALAFVFYKKKGRVRAKKGVKLTQPFALAPALKFGGLFAGILVISRIAQLLFGKVGIYVTSILSGLADVDAITLTMSSLSKAGGITDIVATTAIILAVASNVLVKAGITYFMGNKKFGKYVLWAFLAILAIGGIVLVL